MDADALHPPDPPEASPPPPSGDLHPDDTMLIRVSGPDHPGITTDLMTVFQEVAAEVQDLEQVLLRGHLTLAAVIETPSEPKVLTDRLTAFASDRQLRVEIDRVASVPSDKGSVHAVTVLGHELEAALSPAELGAIAHGIAAAGGNIDRIVRLARYPVYAYEFRVTGAEPITLHRLLGEAAATHRLDVAMQPEGIGRRAKRLVVLDVDSTLIQDEVIELLAREAGCLDQVRSVTERAMAGEIDFEIALRDRVRLLKGLDTAALERARQAVRLTPGARTFVRTLKRLGYSVGIVSGGFTQFTDGLAAELELDHAEANVLEIVDGRLTGEVLGPVVDRERKAALLRSFARSEGVPLSQAVAVGDGANDLDMLATAGLGIAFNAKQVVQEAADTTVNVPYLDAILFVLGVTRDEVERADTVVLDD